jgi:hypothetical protein
LGLDGGESFIAARGKGVRKDGREIFKRHFILLILCSKGAAVWSSLPSLRPGVCRPRSKHWSWMPKPVRHDEEISGFFPKEPDPPRIRWPRPIENYSRPATR